MTQAPESVNEVRTIIWPLLKCECQKLPFLAGVSFPNEEEGTNPGFPV